MALDGLALAREGVGFGPLATAHFGLWGDGGQPASELGWVAFRVRSKSATAEPMAANVLFGISATYSVAISLSLAWTASLTDRNAG